MPKRKRMGPQREDFGLLMLRLAVGGTLVAHGTQKLFGWFGGDGPTGTGTLFEAIGFRPGKRNALMAGLAETGSGTLLALGLGTPAAGSAAAATMATAASVHAPHGFFAAGGGLEHPGIVGTAAASLAVAGPGRFSLDHLTGHVLDRRWMLPAALAVSAAGAAWVISVRLKALEADRAEQERAESPGRRNEGRSGGRAAA